MFRTTTTAALLFIATVALHAQAAWEAPLAAQLERIESAPKDARAATLKDVAATTERIALANPGAWLPNYYAAHFSLLQHWMAGEDGCEPCLDKTDSFLAAAEEAENNSEVLTLRASYYQAMLNVHPMRAPYYGPKAGSLLEKAAKADPTNPRAASLLGQNYFYTPAMFGGGADKAIPHLERAVELFEAESADAERNALLPTWGADRASAMHSRAVASNG